MKPLRRVAVLGAGTMGSRIAAHFANAGIPALLLDIVLPDQPNRNAAALNGHRNRGQAEARRLSSRRSRHALVTPGNFEDNLGRVRQLRLDHRSRRRKSRNQARACWRRVAGVRQPGAILSTNTSGIPLAQISEGFAAEFRAHFLGTHFFNPPRYLHLVEVIPGAGHRPEVLAVRRRFLRSPPRQRRGAAARTRRTSSPTASAASSAPRSTS